MSTLEFPPVIPKINLSAELNNQLLSYCTEGYEFRPQYQPQCIASVINAFEEKQRFQFHLGCGAGKTDIFLLSTLHYLVKKNLNNALLTAPRLALIAQHVSDIEKLIANGKRSGVINSDFVLTIVEISSKDKKQKDEDTASEEVDGIDEEDYKKIIENENVKYITSKNNNRLISKYLDEKNILFVGCIPSVQKHLLPILRSSGKRIDTCINDEYHNLISQSSKKDKKIAFKELFSFCDSVLSFSATPRRGKIMSSVSSDTEDDDNMFGKEVANITTAHLKQFQYLKKHFKVIFVEAGKTRKVSNADRASFEAKNIDVQQFYQEWNIILKVISDMIHIHEPTKKPHLLTATSRVAIINELYQNKDFRAKVFELIPEDSLINVVTGSTSEDDREKIFKALREASINMPSLTMQHSVIAEGINVTNFNVAVILRGMNEVVMNQFINRVTRSHNDYDTSYIYVQVDRDDDDSYKNSIKTFLSKLLTYGITLADVDVEAVSLVDDVKTSDRPDNEDLINVVGDFTFKSLKLELEEVLNDAELDEYDSILNQETDDELFAGILKCIK